MLEEKIKEILHSRRPLEKKLDDILFLIAERENIFFKKVKKAYKDCGDSNNRV